MGVRIPPRVPFTQKEIAMNVFVYGTLRKGFWNHHLLKDSKYLGTFREDIKMDMVDLGAFPGLVPYNGDFSFYVTVEAYEIDNKTLERLDRLEGYPTFYNRKEITIKGITGYIYYLNQEDNNIKSSYNNFKTIVKSGDWLEYKHTSCIEV
jgi:gamma-glutamylaminecyclotransferase